MVREYSVYTNYQKLVVATGRNKVPQILQIMKWANVWGFRKVACDKSVYLSWSLKMKWTAIVMDSDRVIKSDDKIFQSDLIID